MTWTHPTGNSPKTVALVCLGPSRNSYIGAHFEQDLSEAILGTDEVWTLNRGIGPFSHDLLFVMDHIQGEADKYPRYGAALWKHNKPIITSDDCEGWPAHVHRYPFKEVWNWTISALNPMHGDWYHNSVAYILTYAAFIGVKELRIFGADYSLHHNGAVEDGHPCVAYWVGKLEAAGMVVKAPAESAFLNTNQRSWIYGYRYDPRTIPNNRKRFRDLVGLSAEPDTTALLSGERQVAPDLSRIQPDHVYRYVFAASKVSGTVLDLGCGIGYGSALMADNILVSRVTAVDRSAESIDYAKQHYSRDNIVHMVADLRDLVTDAVDWAVAFELIEHLPDPEPLLLGLSARRLLASVPNEAVVPYSPETAPHHHRHYHQHELEVLLMKCGWQAVSWYGQQNREGPVVDYQPDCRTIIVEAERCQPANG